MRQKRNFIYKKKLRIRFNGTIFFLRILKTLYGPFAMQKRGLTFFESPLYRRKLLENDLYTNVAFSLGAST